MNISSLYQYASVYNQSYSSLSTSAVQASQQGDSGSFDSVLGAMFSNSDGDTVQLSAQGMAMGGGNSDIKSFLDKVASGTVTDSDLQSMQSELQQAEKSGSTQSTSKTAGPPPPPPGVPPMSAQGAASSQTTSNSTSNDNTSNLTLMSQLFTSLINAYSNTNANTVDNSLQNITV